MPSSVPSLLPVLERVLNSGLSFQSAFSDFPLAVTVMDAGARVLFLNTAAESLFGWSAAEVLGNVSPLAPDELAEQCRHILGQIFAGETIRGIETTRIHKNGTRVPVELWAVPLRDANGAIHASLGVLLDLTERRRTLRDHQYLLQHLHDAVLLYDAETEIVLEANRRACELYGVTRAQLLGTSLADFSTESRSARAATIRAVEQETVSAYETVHRSHDGTLLHFEANATSLDYQGRKVILSAARDVTERKQLESDLMQAQKLEAVGLLAAGVAHDFSNVLTSVLGAASMLADELGTDHPLRGLAEEITAGAERGAALTQRLMSFGRRQAVELEVLDLRVVVQQLTSWLRRIVEESVSLNIVAGAEPALVFADRSQLEQIILNLVLNARDAMPCGGTIEIATRCVNLDASSAHPLREGGHVELRVSDTGQGMTSETMERAFTPFFTTKAPGKGTGLGLSTVRTIARQSGGHVELDSEMDRGTTVTVTLPASTAPARITPMHAAERPQPRAGATVLVVEDEATVRRTAVRILKKAGYHVLAAAGAAEARTRFAHHDIDVMITDVMMPGESGPELARAMSAAEPNLKVGFMSGYVPEHGVTFGGGPFVQKPFTPQELEQLVATALASESEDA